MAQQFQQAAEVGLGTIVSAGAALASTTLPSLPTDAIHCIIAVVAGTLYIENDGTAADANCLPITPSAPYIIKNCSTTDMARYRVFAAAAYDARFQYAK